MSVYVVVSRWEGQAENQLVTNSLGYAKEFVSQVRETNEGNSYEIEKWERSEIIEPSAGGIRRKPVVVYEFSSLG